VELLADKITEVNERNFINSIRWYEREETQRLLLLLLTLLITALVMIRILHAKYAKDKMRIAMGLPAKLEQPKLDKFDSSLLALPQEEEDDDDEEEDEEEEEELLLEEEIEEEDEEDEEETLEEEWQDEEELLVEELLEEVDDEFEDMELDERTVMILPDELPEHLFLDGSLLGEMDIIVDQDDEMLDDEMDMESISLIARARAALAREETETVVDTSEDDLIKLELRDRITAFIINSPDMALKIFRIFYHQNEKE
jgi:flagellar motor protein MotB